MKKFLILFLLCLSLCACSNNTFNVFKPSTKSSLLTPLKVRTTVKEYKIVGNVSGAYSQTCFLLGLFCTNDVFINDDLMKKTLAMGGNDMLNVVIDEQKTSAFWYLLFSHIEYRANGLAVKITQTDKNARDLYSSD